MANTLNYEIESIIKILKGFSLESKTPEALTNAALITLGDKIRRIMIKGDVSDDDLQWIRDYCTDIRNFWGSLPPWLRKKLSKVSSSASFSIKSSGHEQIIKKINSIGYEYTDLANTFIGVYNRVAA